MNEKRDLIIIGGGPGGYVAAIRAAQLGLGVTLVEQEHLGGVCLNWGCIPTKSLLRNAEVISLLNEGKSFGFTLESVQADYGAAVQRSRRVADRLVKGVAALMKKNDVQVLEGTGRLTGPDTVQVALNDGQSIALQAGHVIVATGSQARAIPGVEVDGERVITARHALEMRELPQSAVIVGAGPIGVEFAYLWQTYGVAVTVVEMTPRLLPLEDEQVSAEIEKAFRRYKVRALTATRVVSVHPSADGVTVQVQGSSGQQETLAADKTLVAIGVRPNSADMGLEEVGVELRQGWVVVDEAMRTTVPGIWAIGDVTGKLPLAHVASAQGIVAAERIAGLAPPPLDYDAIPRCTYCQPQAASFGLTEAQAREQGYDVRVGTFPFLPNGKALALDDNRGFVKLVADGATERLLGGHLVGPEVTELLPELILARSAGLSPAAIARSIHAHPTLGEALAEAAHGLFGSPIHL
ncbi:MAG: dihydrolipoyl dehydrogenase [Anaerolineae bacterium]|nr:dihydrolipoyl dehydrogenase [Anaerolineae bacterium]